VVRVSPKIGRTAGIEWLTTSVGAMGCRKPLLIFYRERPAPWHVPNHNGVAVNWAGCRLQRNSLHSLAQWSHKLPYSPVKSCCWYQYQIKPGPRFTEQGERVPTLLLLPGIQIVLATQPEMAIVVIAVKVPAHRSAGSNSWRRNTPGGPKSAKYPRLRIALLPCARS